MNDACVHIANEKDLQETLRTRKKVIALFYASWCPFCVRFLPVFRKKAEQEGQYFAAVQDDRDTLGDPYSIKILPTVIFFENGAVSKRLDGISGIGLNERQFEDFVTSCRITREEEPVSRLFPK
jgi:thiol-disulfide isomerase/thioredoxin